MLFDKIAIANRVEIALRILSIQIAVKVAIAHHQSETIRNLSLVSTRKGSILRYDSSYLLKECSSTKF